MKGSFYLTLIFLFIFASTIQAAQQETKQDKFDVKENVTTIASIAEEIDSLMSCGTQAQKILVVFDVDGTLTTDPHPKIWGESSGAEVKARGDAINVVLKLSNNGVKIVASSAWDDFKATEWRLQKLGLSKAFGADEGGSISLSKGSGIFEGGPAIEGGHQHGKVVSVRGSHSEDKRYFRQKAFAPYFVFKKEELQDVEYLFFLDDSNGNIDTFKNDVTNFNLFPKGKMMLRHLGDPKFDVAGPPPRPKKTAKPEECYNLKSEPIFQSLEEVQRQVKELKEVKLIEEAIKRFNSKNVDKISKENIVVTKSREEAGTKITEENASNRKIYIWESQSKIGSIGMNYFGLARPIQLNEETTPFKK